MINKKWREILADTEKCKTATENFKANFNENLKKLTKKELLILRRILPQSGVFFVQGTPGSAKSSILKSIADKMGMLFIDLRLSQIEETDIGLYPDKVKIGDLSYIDHIPPKWAYYTNLVPSLIAYEELNRCSKYVRNASMQLFQERAIGYDFIFNDNVYMVATGNLGKDDRTDVEEFDDAQFERLLPYRYELSVSEWVEGFANNKIHSMIIKYLLNNETKMTEQSNKAGDKSASCRTWTQLSDYIITTYGEFNSDKTIKSEPKLSEDILNDIINNASMYINGYAIKNFVNYVLNEYAISLKDILDEFPKIKDKLKGLDRGRVSQLVNELSSYQHDTLNETNIDNLVAFLESLDKSMDDEISAYVHTLVKKAGVKSKEIYTILKRLEKYVKAISQNHTEYMESSLK